MSMNENVKKLLKEQMWYLATYAEEPNAVPVLFREAAGDGPGFTWADRRELEELAVPSAFGKFLEEVRRALEEETR